MTDEELLLAYRTTKDNQWIGLLLQRYTTLLLGVAMKYLKDREQAEDAVQQVFITVLMHLPGEQIHNFKGWLYILIRNHCLQQLRNKPTNAGENALEHLPAAEPYQDDIAWQDYSLQQLENAIEELNEEQRTAIVLFYLKRYSYEQIIEKTGYTFMQVKSYIQNGKRNLKTILLKKTIKTR